MDRYETEKPYRNPNKQVLWDETRERSVWRKDKSWRWVRRDTKAAAPRESKQAPNKHQKVYLFGGSERGSARKSTELAQYRNDKLGKLGPASKCRKVELTPEEIAKAMSSLERS